jgi:hypothetical protein
MSRIGFLSSAMWAMALLAVITHLPALAAAPAEWQVLSHKDGLLIERRANEGSDLYEVRATTHSSLTPAAIFDTIWKQQEHPQFVPYLKRLDLLLEEGDERLTYEQVQVPWAADRDYTVRLLKRVEVEEQRYEILFLTANDAGPPPTKHHIRVSSIRGRWLIGPGPNGQGATVRYEVLSDPGGYLPGWIVNQVQGEGVTRLVRSMLQRTREKARQT